jgi:hypothetical protein
LLAVYDEMRPVNPLCQEHARRGTFKVPRRLFELLGGVSLYGGGAADCPLGHISKGLSESQIERMPIVAQMSIAPAAVAFFQFSCRVVRAG